MKANINLLVLCANNDFISEIKTGIRNIGINITPVNTGTASVWAVNSGPTISVIYMA